jgi:hypothetical protein
MPTNVPFGPIKQKPGFRRLLGAFATPAVGVTKIGPWMASAGPSSGAKTVVFCSHAKKG